MTTIEEIIKSYNPKTIEETKAIIRELLQQIVLIGLSRSGFFNYASFYGGTALRIFYGLNRYSEDLDFTLNKEDLNFSIEPFVNKIIEVAHSYGFDIEIQTKIKNIKTPIENAFAKLNTYQTFINLKINDRLVNLLHKDELIKVKFEIDCNPSLGFNVENKYLSMLEFANVAVLDKESLFARKLHALLCRSYKNNVKGRDYYDFLFFIQRKIKPNLNYLRNKLIESHKINENDEFNIDNLKNMLKKRFDEVDFDLVKNDAEHFVFKNEDLSYFSKELFIDIVDTL